MADDDVDVTLRLKAIDDSARVLTDAARNAQALNTSLVSGMNASAKATQSAATAIAQFTGFLAATKKETQEAAEATAKHDAVMRAATAGTSGFASSIGVANMNALKFVGGLVSIGEAVNFVIEGYRKFAESERAMTRIQLDARASAEEMQHLGHTIHELSALTGQTGSVLEQNFARFREQSGLVFEDAEQAFKGVEKAAFAAGTSSQGMAKLVVSAIADLKVPKEEVNAMLEGWTKTVPSSMAGAFAETAPRIMNLLHGLGYSGTKTAVELGSAFSDIALKLGGNTRMAANVIENLFSKATDIGTSFGARTIPLLQRVVGKPDEFRQSMEIYYKVLQQTGYYNTQDLAIKSAIRAQTGLDASTFDLVKEQHKSRENDIALAKKYKMEVVDLSYYERRLAQDQQHTLDVIHASADQAYTSVGKLLSLSGLPNNLADSLTKDVAVLKDMVDAVEQLKKLLSKDKTGMPLQEFRTKGPKTLDTTSAEGPAETLEDARNRGYMGDDPGTEFRWTPGTRNRFRIGFEAGSAMNRYMKGRANIYRPPEEDPKVQTDKNQRAADVAKGERIAQDRRDMERDQKDREFNARERGDRDDTNTRNRLERVSPRHMATGGEFTVPGTGRGDDQPVSFMGTPGERVKVESIPDRDTKESLQKQQDKADLALQQHFARFQTKLRPGAQIDYNAWPHDRLASLGGSATSGTGSTGGGTGGTGRDGTGRRGTGKDGTGKDGTVPADGATPGLKVPTSLDPTLETGPAETVEDAKKRGYIRTEGGEGGKFTDVPALKGRGPEGTLDKDVLYKTLYNNVPNELIGKKPTDGARFGIITGSREEWAKLQLKLALQESGGSTNPPPEPGHHGTAGLFQMEQKDISYWGGKGSSVTNPNDQIRAMNNVFKKFILRDNAIGGQARWPGKGDYGAGAYFGPLRDSGPNRGKIAGREHEAAPVVGRNPAPGDDAHPASVSGFKVGDIPGAGGGDQSTITPGLNPDGSALPARIQSRSGEDPAAFIAHHTSGGPKETVAGIVEYWRKGGKGIGAQYIMDHEGNIHDVKAEFGYTGTGHIKPAGVYDDSGGQSRKIADFPVGDPRRGISNANAVGMEIMASDDKHVRAIQAKKFAEFMEKRYPTTTIFGHGEVNVGHKEKDEGLTAKRAALALREQRKAAPKPAIAAATPTPAASGKKALSHLPTDTKPEHPEHTKLYPDYSKRHDAPASASASASAEAAPEGKQYGGNTYEGQPYVVGEQGPEVVVPGAGRVIGQSGSAQKGGNASGSLGSPAVIEPIIRPRIQQMGPLSMRWTRQSERQRSRDINRDEARRAPTDQGFA